METLLIRRLDSSIKIRIRVLAARHGRSMEEEAREILRRGVMEAEPRPNLADSIRQHVLPLGGIDLPLPEREAIRRPPQFDE